MKKNIQFRVRYAETDAMGIVHHANYYVWFEMGRTEYLREMGFNYKDMEDEGLFSPVIETNCKYKRPAKYDDLITLETYIKDTGKARWSFGYRVLRDGELLAEGHTSHCFMDENGRPIILKRVNPELYQKMVDKNLLK